MLLRLSDGASEFRAIERSNIDGLSLLSCPGSKVLNFCVDLKIENVLFS